MVPTVRLLFCITWLQDAEQLLFIFPRKYSSHRLLAYVFGLLKTWRQWGSFIISYCLVLCFPLDPSFSWPWCFPFIIWFSLFYYSPECINVSFWIMDYLFQFPSWDSEEMTEACNGHHSLFPVLWGKGGSERNVFFVLWIISSPLKGSIYSQFWF